MGEMKMGEKRTMQYLAAFAVALTSMTASSAYSWTAPVIPKFHNNETDFSLTDNEISWVVSSVAPGMMCGCLLAQSTSDSLGRRATLLVTALPFNIGTMFVVFATEAWMLYVARFCWGIGAGAITPTAMIYLSEISAKDIRGKLSTIRHFMFTFGSLLTVAVGALVAYRTLSYLLVFLSICYFLACWCIPESPYFLMKSGKIDRAKKAFKTLNGHKDDKHVEETLSSMLTQVRHEMQNPTTFKELITGVQYRKAVFIAVGLRTTQLLTGSIAIQQYLGSILLETDASISVSTGLIIYASLRFSSSMVASFVIDKAGRRPLVFFSYSCAFILHVLLGTMFFFHEYLNKTPSHFGQITLCILILFTMIINLGFDTVNFVIVAEIFPINVKATALTSLNLYTSSITFIALRGFQVLKDFSGFYAVFWFFACFAFAGATFSYLVLPETKGKSLKEIQQQFQGSLYDDEAQEKLRKGTEQQTDQETKELGKSDDSNDLKV